MLGEPTGMKAFFNNLIPSKFDSTKCKINLDLSVQRLKLLRNKKQFEVKGLYKEIAELLRAQKDESATIKVEHVIRLDKEIEALDLIELYCELLIARNQLLVSEKVCPDEIRQAVATLMWAAPSAQINELMEVRKQLALKYGKHFARAAVQNSQDWVNSKVIEKLTYRTPESMLVLNYLNTIAEKFGVEWRAPETFPHSNEVVPSGLAGTYAAVDTPAVYPPAGGGGGVPPPATGPPPSNGGGGGGGGSGGGDFVDPVKPGVQPGVQPFPTAGPGYDAEADFVKPAPNNYPDMDAPPGPSMPVPPGVAEIPDAKGDDDADGGVPGFDELTARFDALKKRS